jgi:two-component system, NtrC family, sensor kinase
MTSEFVDFDAECNPEPLNQATSKDDPQELLKAHRRLEYLIDNTPNILYRSVPTGDFKMTFVSANAKRVLGYDPDEMVRDPNFWFDHIHSDDIATIFSTLASLFVDGQRTYEYRFRAKNGRYLWMHDTLRLTRDDEGAPLEVIGSLVDITDRRLMEETLKRTDEEQKRLIARLQQAQDQLLQSEKMASIGQLAAGVAHEINNPVGFVNSNMSSLRNYVDTLIGLVKHIDEVLVQTALPPEARVRIEQLKSEADLEFLKEDIKDLVHESMDGLKRVKDIVQSLKEFSHVGETDWQIADLHQGLDSTIGIANNEIKYKATLVRNYGNLPPVKCMPSQLNQVFLNLLVNAAHAIHSAGTITVSTGAEEDGWVWIEISDTGDGIAPEHLTRIFEPFFTTKPVGKGTGLGLSLSYSIVKRHGGQIMVDSVLGKGTVFRVRIPVDPAVPVSEAGLC